MHQKIIFITGCSTGIGYDSSIAMKNSGHRVIASCRKPSDLDRLKNEGLEAILMDVDDVDSINNAFTDLMNRTSGKLDVLINNAGYGQAGALEDVPREALIAQFNTNVFGMMELIRLVVPVMRKQGYGRIINVSSLLGFVSMPFRGAYNASKYAVEGISDTLRLELSSSNIHVITIEPGPISSRFRDNVIDSSMRNIDIEQSYFKPQYQRMLSSFKRKKSDSFFTQDTNSVIKKLTHAVNARSPKAKYMVTFPTYLFATLKRLLTTRMLDKFMGFLSKEELK